MNNFVWFSIATFIFAIFLFMVSFHYIDIAWNMESICFDKSIYGLIQSREEIYMKAGQYFFDALWVAIFSFLLLLFEKRKVLI